MPKLQKILDQFNLKLKINFFLKLHNSFEMRASLFSDNFFKKKDFNTSSKKTAERLFKPLLIVLRAALKTQAKKRPGKPGVDLNVSITNRGKSLSFF